MSLGSPVTPSCQPSRFDLTVECIRRHYAAGDSPLAATLARYADFFALFEDFQGYVEYFLLQDLVAPDCSAVRLAAPLPPFPSCAKRPDPQLDERPFFRRHHHSGRVRSVALGGCELLHGALGTSGGLGYRVAGGGCPRVRCHSGSGSCDGWRRTGGLPHAGARRAPGPRSYRRHARRLPSRQAGRSLPGRSHRRRTASC